MAVRLLQLSNGHVSLEFETDDMSTVASAISRLYGEPKVDRHVTSAEYRFGGCSFVFQNQWDDPCLISGSADGDVVLEILAAAINSESAPS